MPQSSAVRGASRAPLYYSAIMPSSSALPTQMLNGASNLIPRFGLLPLYLTAVKPYRRTASDEDPSKIRKLNFTYEHYVEDLPGACYVLLSANAHHRDCALTKSLTISQAA